MRAPQPRPIDMDRDRGEILGSGEFVQQSLRRLQIGGPEPFGEAAIHRRQKIECLSPPALVAPQSGEARSSPQFPRQSPLSSRPIERTQETVLCDGGVRFVLQYQKLAFETQHFWHAPQFLIALGAL